MLSLKDQIRHIEPGFGHWLAGFVDGEGCFLIRRYMGGKRARRESYGMQFAIRLRADDVAILREIRDTTGLGGLSGGSYDARYPNSKPFAQWCITGRADCRALVAIFDQYPLRAKKARDFAIWREAVLAWQSIRCLGPYRNDWGPIPDLWARIKEVRKFDFEDFSVPTIRDHQLDLLGSRFTKVSS